MVLEEIFMAVKRIKTEARQRKRDGQTYTGGEGSERNKERQTERERAVRIREMKMFKMIYLVYAQFILFKPILKEKTVGVADKKFTDIHSR